MHSLDLQILCSISSTKKNQRTSLFVLIHTRQQKDTPILLITKPTARKHQKTFLDSLPDIKRIIEGFNIPVVELDGYEADDVIGTVAWQACEKGYDVYMVTPDKDYGQLL
jgi:5'-3' exonuclease